MRVFVSAILAAVTVAAGLAGCQSSGASGRTTLGSIPPLDAAAASAAGLSAQEVSDATGLYVAKCARCHKFYNPAEYSDSEWRTWMTKMNRKARLNPEQAELLSRYLGTFRMAAKRGGDRPVR